MIVWAWTAASAAAAEVRTDSGCYREGADVRVTATGFAPGAVFSALLDGVRLGGGLVEQAGQVEATLPAPGLPSGVHERRHYIGVLDAAGAAAAAVFRVYGMRPGRTVTVRWISPAGRVVRSASLGRAGAPCGRVTTARRRLFPFTPSPGAWRVRFSSGARRAELRVRVFRAR